MQEAKNKKLPGSPVVYTFLGNETTARFTPAERALQTNTAARWSRYAGFACGKVGDRVEARLTEAVPANLQLHALSALDRAEADGTVAIDKFGTVLILLLLSAAADSSRFALRGARNERSDARRNLVSGHQCR